MKLSSGLVVMALAAALLVGCGEDATTPTASDPEPTSPGSTPPSEAPTDTATSEPATPAGSVTVPVYFVGDSPMGARLYREFRTVEADNPADEALALLLAGDALDPDYSTLLQAVDLGPVEVRDDEIGVAIGSGPYPRPDGMSGAEARIALQSLVYTLQGVTQTRLPIQFEGDDDAAQELYGIDVSGPIEAADQLDVASLVNITTPESGATVSGSFTAEGVANSFEATVVWQILDSGGRVVDEYSTMAEGAYDRLYPWSTEIDVSELAPGEYTFVAKTDDPTGGEGPGPFVDTKTITIE